MYIVASSLLTALAIPALLAIGGFIAWAVRSTIEEYREAERQLTAERRAIYQQVLEPFLLPLLANDADADPAKHEEVFASAEYKRAVFEMTLFASDEVVRVFGDMTNRPEDSSAQPLVLWARLLLAIRKSVGNKGSQLSLVDMLRPMINDLDANPEILRELKEAG
jgi:hypothetical protein